MRVVFNAQPPLRLQVSSALHAESQAMLLGGSHSSPTDASVKESPQNDGRQEPCRQMRFVPQAEPSSSAAVLTHFLAPGVPDTVAHVSTPLHGSASSQPAFVEHEGWHPASHPSPPTLLPSSQDRKSTRLNSSHR